MPRKAVRKEYNVINVEAVRTPEEDERYWKNLKQVLAEVAIRNNATCPYPKEYHPKKKADK